MPHLPSSSTVAILVKNCNIPLPNPLNLPVVERVSIDYTAYLVIDEEQLSLWIPHLAKTPFHLTTDEGSMAYRLNKVKAQRELIARACDITHTPRHILDATAGFGRDAYILAASGAKVTLVERHPVLALLLKHSIEHLHDKTLQDRLELIHADSTTILAAYATSNQKPDVIYLDPMFEEKRHAKVKKELQFLQYLLGKPEPQEKFLPLALKAAKHRVVVKRAIHAPPLNEMSPSFTLKGKHSRFDVYHILS